MDFFVRQNAIMALTSNLAKGVNCQAFQGSSNYKESEIGGGNKIGVEETNAALLEFWMGVEEIKEQF